MSFRLYKLRVNAHYHQIKKLFATEGPFQIMLQSLGDVQVLHPLSELNLESASTVFHLEANQTHTQIEVNFMQSTSKTTRCFDIYLRVQPESPSSLDKSITHFLEDVKLRFNQNWHIQDADLTLSLLK